MWPIDVDSGTIGLDQPKPLASIGKEVNMKELVRLRMRPSRNKKSFRYMLDYKDQSGKRRQISLGHANKRRAERQRYEKELELRMNVAAPI